MISGGDIIYRLAGCGDDTSTILSKSLSKHLFIQTFFQHTTIVVINISNVDIIIAISKIRVKSKRDA